MLKGSKIESKAEEHEYGGQGHFHPAPLLATPLPPRDSTLQWLQVGHVEECVDEICGEEHSWIRGQRVKKTSRNTDTTNGYTNT